MNPILEKTAEALRRRGFLAVCVPSAPEAARFLLGDIAPGAGVAIGGSQTIRDMNLAAQLREAGHDVLWHWEVAPAERPALLHEAMHMPVYLCSANALTESGLIVQIDGNGNRVAAMCYGPQSVYLIVGRNKLVSGSYPQAVARIKREACPANARRQGLDTPCASGACNAAACAHSMCHIFAAFELAPNGKKTTVILVDEALGF